MPLAKSSQVQEAVLVQMGQEQVVRATKRRNSTARVLLETHYFFPLGDEAMYGLGPFIALQPGTDEIIEAAGVGLLIGARRKSGSDSFNLGVGILMEPRVRDLGDDITLNESLPAGETEIRFQEKALTSLLILASFAF